MSVQDVLNVVTAAVNSSTAALPDRERFLSARLETPIRGVITTDDFHAKNLGTRAGKHEVWFVTMNEPQSVFFDESVGLFGSCWGPAAAGEYENIGYRSGDPIEMFLV